jgi:hypothetical protein
MSEPLADGQRHERTKDGDEERERPMVPLSYALIWMDTALDLGRQNDILWHYLAVLLTGYVEKTELIEYAFTEIERKYAA